MPAIVRLLPLLVCCVFLDPVAATGAAGAPGKLALDGLRFVGETGEQGKGDDHDDTIAFEDGLFRSLDFESWGFGAAPYTVENDGEGYRFRATLVSPSRGRLEWEGTIKGDTASATFRWLHERWYWSIDRRYWFEGTREANE